MEVAEILRDILRTCSCPLCMCYLRDPLSLECGDHVCWECISECQTSDVNRFPCPECEEQCEKLKARKNAKMGIIVDAAREIFFTAFCTEVQDKIPLCEMHNQVLTHFCEKDMMLLCARCIQRPVHRGHRLRTLEEAAHHYSHELQIQLSL